MDPYAIWLESQYEQSPIQFIREWQVNAATIMGLGAQRKGDYHLKDMRGVCEELVRLEEALA